MPAEPRDAPIQMVVDMRLIEAADRVGEGQGGGQLEDCLKETDYCLLFRVRFHGCAAPAGVLHADRLVERYARLP